GLGLRPHLGASHAESMAYKLHDRQRPRWTGSEPARNGFEHGRGEFPCRMTLVAARSGWDSLQQSLVVARVRGGLMSVVAVLKTSPRTVLRDYHRVMNLAGYRDVIADDVDTALKVNISWHFFFPGSSTTPWQLEGVIRAMKRDGYSPERIHACHNRTVVIDAHLGERENKQLEVVERHGIRSVHLYDGEEWVHIRDA